MAEPTTYTQAMMLRDAAAYLASCREELISLLASIQRDRDDAGILVAVTKLAGSLEAAGHCIEMVQGDPK